MKTIAAAVIASFITQSNAMETETKALNSGSFAHEYGNNFKELEKHRAQQDHDSVKDPIRYWIINQLDRSIDATTTTYTATPTLLKKDNITAHNTDHVIPPKFFTAILDSDFDHLEKCLGYGPNAHDEVCIQPVIKFTLKVIVMGTESNYNREIYINDDPFGSIILLNYELVNRSVKVERLWGISFMDIMDIIFSMEETSFLTCLPKHLRQLIGFKYLELATQEPKFDDDDNNESESNILQYREIYI